MKVEAKLLDVINVSFPPPQSRSWHHQYTLLAIQGACLHASSALGSPLWTPGVRGRSRGEEEEEPQLLQREGQQAEQAERTGEPLWERK